MKFEIFYTKNMRDDYYKALAPERFGEFEAIDVVMEITHARMGDMEAENAEQVWSRLNHPGSAWLNGGITDEQQAIIENQVHHTSMSMGDVLVDKDGRLHIAESIGFRTLEDERVMRLATKFKRN